MTSPYGNPYQQPPMPGGYPMQKPPSGGTAITAGLFGILASVALAAVPIQTLSNFPSGASISDLPGSAITVLALYFAAALAMLLGAIIAFCRSIGGGVLLLIGVILAVATILIEPAVGGASYGAYFRALFDVTGDQFGIGGPNFRFGGVVLTGVVLLFLIMPPTWRYLGSKRTMQHMAAPAGYPGW